MNKIKLIGIDLDGTALNSRKELTVKNIEAFNECRKRGIHIVPVTGRPYSGVYDEYKSGMKCDYTINTNGAAVMEVKSGKRVISHTMSPDKALEVMKAVKDFNCYYGVFHDGYGYLTPERLSFELEKYKNTPLHKYILSTRKPVKNQAEFIKRAGSCDNIYVIAENEKVRNEIRAAIKDINAIFFTSSAHDDVEIGGNCSKGKALLELADYLGIEKSGVMAIGDSGNDVEMLKHAGISVAMDNADDAVKRVCDYVTASCEDSGVASAIEKFVLC